MTAIFISYRREDSPHVVGRLHDQILHHFRPDQVFMDLDTLEPGVDFFKMV